MNVESFNFILAVALFGILVVFVLLILLSAFMSGMLGADRRIPAGSVGGTVTPRAETRTARKQARARAAAGTVSDSGPTSGSGAGPASPDWVVAAAIAYLMLEEEQVRPEAASWTAGRSFREDPWLMHNIGDQT
jgi:Na+/H+-translocating membrane pyrophosphatase